MNFKSLEIVKHSKNQNNTFSLIIPSWNNLPYLKLCIRSIRENSHFKHQIIVVVNEGKDGTLEWIQSEEDIDYVFSQKNLGICYGLNVCRPLIETDYIVYINDDMYLLPDWDKIFYDEIKALSHREFMLSSTMIEPHNTNNPCAIVGDYGDSLESFKEKELLKTFRDFQKSDWSGSTWPPLLIPTVLWDLVGGMSVEFSPGMYSDPDLSMKLWQLGVRYFKGISASRVYHFGSKSTKRVKKNRGKNKFLQKYGITSRSFTQYYLKRGEDFNGLIPEPKISVVEKSINKLKLLWHNL
ncbi:MAG: glycosyltransferase family 2 protein [Bacteroidales bacterium]|nr:glycosyltransferase family 2 protein [Bacteroidales bacterium]